ncbi:alpha/beta hydrolase [Arthrobacter sp. ZBG10]|uniref:alpha/beta fold hydrolase n=1 Tax=Arthrobacter sp. ZBG10 TaxID=1676590 RepID=UPI0006816EE4|nr:alpha/beta fold hydrolase [Arthrobacter sp. ZBG10]KNH22989.1 alpha/beta hydrolase [Arthrobacter sp. ZBG10]
MTLSGGRAVESGGLHGTLYATAGPQAGGGQRPAYVLLHGIGVSHRYLSRLHRELARDADVYSFDLPGFGGTPRPPRQLQAADYAAFVLGAMAAERPGTFVVVGHSMGSQFAVEAALQAPDRVTAVVLMGPVVDAARRSVPRQAAALTRDAMFSESPGANSIVFTDYFRAGPRWYLTELPVMMAYAMEDRLAGVAQPVLVLRGARDPVARLPWCRRLAAAARNGAVAEVAGQGHVFQHTAAGVAAAAISSWVRAPDGFGVTA